MLQAVSVVVCANRAAARERGCGGWVSGWVGGEGGGGRHLGVWAESEEGHRALCLSLAHLRDLLTSGIGILKLMVAFFIFICSVASYVARAVCFMVDNIGSDSPPPPPPLTTTTSTSITRYNHQRCFNYTFSSPPRYTTTT